MTIFYDIRAKASLIEGADDFSEEEMVLMRRFGVEQIESAPAFTPGTLR